MTAPSCSCTELKIRSEIFPVILPKLEIIYYVIQLFHVTAIGFSGSRNMRLLVTFPQQNRHCSFL